MSFTLCDNERVKFTFILKRGTRVHSVVEVNAPNCFETRMLALIIRLKLIITSEHANMIYGDVSVCIDINWLKQNPNNNE